MTVFPSGALVVNFAAVGDSVRFDRERLRQVLAHYAIDGRGSSTSAGPATSAG
jgi:hypothetical protein